MTTHSPTTPDWNCAGCGREWPCPPRRSELLAEYGEARVALSVYLGGFLVNAATDLGYVPAGWLHNRFVGWARERTYPISAAEVLVRGHDLALAHVPDGGGDCPSCCDLAGCWVHAAPGDAGLLTPRP